MSKAKEQARELIDKFSYPDKINAHMTKNKQAELCALICVDEIMKIEEYNPIREGTISWEKLHNKVYWQEVKQEIAKRR